MILGLTTYAYADWDATKPACTDTLATSCPEIRANFQAIDGTSGTAPSKVAVGTQLQFEGSTADANETVLTVTDPTADRTLTLPDATGTVISTGNLTDITSTGTLSGASPLTFEGATADDYETTIAVTDPTADRTITLPNHSGTVAVSGADFDLGDYELRAKTLESDVATGTAPLTVASTTKVTNLNADKIDGYDYTETEIKPFYSRLSRSEDTVYQASTDGFFVGLILWTGGNDVGAHITAYAEDANPPTIIRGYACISKHTYSRSVANSFSIPVKKGEYYKATYTVDYGSPSTTRTYYWMPVGN